MGSCISKCKPKTHEPDDYFHVPVHVQDKGVIAQAPTISTTPKLQPSKLSSSSCAQSPTHSASSTSSVTLSSSCDVSSISTASSLSSSTSSALSLKERSFSNEFLWSCAKENQHVVQVDSIKVSGLNPMVKTSCEAQVLKMDSLARESRKRVASGTAQVQQNSDQRVCPIGSRTLQKRSTPSSRSPSPLTRQKSFRCEPDQRLNSACSLPSRTLRSPSPSRRFNGDSTREVLGSSRRRVIDSRTTSAGSWQQQSMIKKGSIRPTSTYNIKEHPRSMSPTNNGISQVGSSPLSAQTRINRVGSKIDEVAVEEALSYKDINSLLLEDMNNPLIALDCFIFL